MNAKIGVSLVLVALVLAVTSIGMAQAKSEGLVTVYSSRKEHLIKPLFESLSLIHI